MCHFSSNQNFTLPVRNYPPKAHTDTMIVCNLLQRGQILVVLCVGIDLCGNVVPYHLKSINEEQPR